MGDPEQITFHAIRLKGTDKYLPQRERQFGHSFSEPVSIEDTPPRMFFTDTSAKKALSAWLLGHHCKTRSTSGPNYYGEYDYEEYIEIKPQPHRRREDMEIVTFQAVEVKS